MDFENDPKFKALSPAAQSIVRQKMATKSAPPPSNFERVRSLYSSYQNNPLIKYGPNLPQTMGDIGQNIANVVGEKIATLPGINPNVAAGVGTAVQMAPMVAGMFTGAGEAQAAARSGELGFPGRVISGPSRQVAGQAIGTAEKAVGVNADVVPTLKDVSANLGLKTANTKQYLNTLMERLKSGEDLGPQALSQHHKMIADILSKEPSMIGKNVFGNGSKIGEPAIAQAAKINKILVQRLNAAAPGRAAEAANYAAAITRNNLYKGAGVTVAGVALGKNAILNALQRITGQ